MAPVPPPSGLAVLGTDPQGLAAVCAYTGLPAGEPDHAGPVLLVASTPAEVARAERLNRDGQLWAVIAWHLPEASVVRLIDMPDSRVAVGVAEELLARLASFGDTERSAERANTVALAQLELAAR